MHGMFERGSGWTAARTQELKRMIVECYSASQAAYELGITRNAAIGKATRLRIHFNSNSPLNGQRVDRPRAPQLYCERRHRPPPKVRVRAAKSAKLPPLAPEPDARRLALLDLTDRDCHYIVTADHPMLYCGHPKAQGSSYCAHHHRVVWMPVGARR